MATDAAASATEGAADRGPIKVIVIAGPTAVGKSALALALCSRLGGEIVSADSVQARYSFPPPRFRLGGTANASALPQTRPSGGAHVAA